MAETTYRNALKKVACSIITVLCDEESKEKKEKFGWIKIKNECEASEKIIRELIETMTHLNLS